MLWGRFIMLKKTLVMALSLCTASIITTNALATEVSKANSSDRLQQISAQKKLRVCIWPDYFSISYKNRKTGQLEGIDIDLAREFASDLGVEVSFVNTHFGIFMNDLESDKCDIAMFGVGRTQARMQRIDFSQPYLSSGMYGITHKTHPIIDSWETMDQPGVIVSVQKGTYMENAMKNSLKQAQIATVIKPGQREIEVRSGRADVFITDYPYGQKMIKNYDWVKLLTPVQATEQFQYAYAVKKDQPQWLKRVDQFVNNIKKDGRLKKYASKNNLLPIALHD